VGIADGIARGIAHHRVAFIGIEIAIEIDFRSWLSRSSRAFPNTSSSCKAAHSNSNFDFDSDPDFDFDYREGGLLVKSVGGAHLTVTPFSQNCWVRSVRSQQF